MLGSSFVHSPDPGRINAIVEGLDAIPTFPCAELVSLTTLDFQTVSAEGGLAWAEGEPVFSDDDRGFAILRINPQALTYVLDHPQAFDPDDAEDFDLLDALVMKNGAEHIYEISIFF